MDKNEIPKLIAHIGDLEEDEAIWADTVVALEATIERDKACFAELRLRMGWLERRGREDDSPCYLAADAIIARYSAPCETCGGNRKVEGKSRGGDKLPELSPCPDCQPRRVLKYICEKCGVVADLDPCPACQPKESDGKVFDPSDPAGLRFKPIGEIAKEIMADVPESEWAKLPANLSETCNNPKWNDTRTYRSAGDEALESE